MDVPAKDIPQGRFFATADPPPDNVWYMAQPPRYKLSRAIKGRRRAKILEPGLCQNINTREFYHIHGNKLVRLIREDEHDQTIFSATGILNGKPLESQAIVPAPAIALASP